MLDTGRWAIDLDDAGAGLDQVRSAQHSLRVELVETQAGGQEEVLSARQVAYYDLSEFGATQAQPTYIHTGGIQTRITDGGLADLADVVTREVEAIHASELVPLLQEINGPGDEVDVTLPVQLCTSLDSLGVNVRLLSIGPADFGLSAGDFATVTGADIELCVSGAHGDLFVDGDRLLSHIPDHNGDGVEDDFLVLDAVPGAVQSTVTVGPVEGGFDLDVRMSLSIAGAVAGLPVAPSVEVVEFEWPLLGVP